MVDMDKRSTIDIWDRLAGMPDSGIPLLRTALLVARDEYPELEVQPSVSDITKALHLPTAVPKERRPRLRFTASRSACVRLTV